MAVYLYFRSQIVKYLSLLNKIQCSLIPSLDTFATASTITSVSTVQIIILLHCLLATSNVSRIILSSASSWVHGVRKSRSASTEQSTFCPLVTYYSLPAGAALITTLVRKENSSYLFSLIQKNSFQFRGILALPKSCCHWPFPLCKHVNFFKLSGKPDKISTIYILKITIDVWHKQQSCKIIECCTGFWLEEMN